MSIIDVSFVAVVAKVLLCANLREVRREELWCEEGEPMPPHVGVGVEFRVERGGGARVASSGEKVASKSVLIVSIYMLLPSCVTAEEETNFATNSPPQPVPTLLHHPTLQTARDTF